MEKMAEEPGKYEFLVIVLDTILHFKEDPFKERNTFHA
jgi:hypothetical protein